MNVYVVMGNDYPDSVFDTQAAAEAYRAMRQDEPGNRQQFGGHRISWRVYEFELRRAKMEATQ